MFAMLIFVALQLAQQTAAAQPPQLLKAQGLITYQDYPSESLRRGEYGIVSVLLRVSAEGKVTSCEVTETSGSATLDSKTCTLLKQRALFEPAKDAGGSAVAGEYRTSSIWGVDQHQPRTTFDIPLQVSRVPAGYQSPVKARLIFDGSGRLTVCEITATSGSEAADRAACAYTKQQFTIKPPRSRSKDVSAAAVRQLSATLTAQSAEAPATK